MALVRTIRRERLGEQQAADYRAFRLMEATMRASGYKGTLEAGKLFPSLARLRQTDDSDLDDDPVTACRNIKAMLGQHQGLLESR